MHGRRELVIRTLISYTTGLTHLYNYSWLKVLGQIKRSSDVISEWPRVLGNDNTNQDGDLHHLGLDFKHMAGDTQFTFLSMAKSSRASELSFQRPHHEVDLVQRAISAGCDANVLCVAKSTSKLFVAAKLIEEVWRRDDKVRKIVFLVESKEAPGVKLFLEAAGNQSCLSVKTCFNDIYDRYGDNLRFLDTDVIVTDGKCFVELLETGQLDLLLISLIVYDSCHMILDKEDPFHGIVRQIACVDSETKPKVVGLLSNILNYQTCAQELEMFLADIEQAFGCRADVSSDLLAMNKYGEQASEEIITYSYDQREDPLHQKCLNILQSTIIFLKDYQTGEAMLPCIKFVKHLVSECYRVILLFGTLCTINVAQAIIKEITKMEKKCSDSHSILILQFCRTQMNLIINVLKSGFTENCNENFTELVAKLLGVLIRDFKPLYFGTDQDDCHVNCLHLSASASGSMDVNSAKGIYYPLHTDELPSSTNSSHCRTKLKSCHTSEINDQKVCHLDLISQDSDNINSRKQRDNPLCVILVPTTIIGKALNALMNRLSSSRTEFMFLKSGFVHGDYSDRSGELEEYSTIEQADSIMRCVKDGSIKIIISTFDAEDRLFIPRCALLVRLGMPRLYENYQNVKRKLRTAGAKFVVCCREEDKADCEKRYKNFKQIESILQKRCPNCRPSCQEVANLFKEETLDSYKPFGEEGPKVDLLSSISLVNRYCSKFPSMGAGPAVVVCRTDETWTDDNIEFLCTLCLPRNSPLYHPIKGAASLKRADASEVMVLKARVKAEMYAALETCRQLHQAGELNQELEPIMKYTMLNMTAESEQYDDEVASNGQGMAGSIKRNRAYKRKFPSLLEHNLPVAGQPCYLYSIDMTLTKPLSFERAIRSQNIAHYSATTYSLGILSRKQLPKLPGMVIFDRAGEVTATVTECQSQPITMTTEQILLIRRFHSFVFREIAKPMNVSLESSLIFDPVTADFGFYTVLLIDTPSENIPDIQSSPSTAKQPAKLIAFDFVKSLDHALGSFESPSDPAPPPVHEVELFRDSVVTATHSEKHRRYYVVDIRYDCSPADLLSNSEVVKTFSEYYQVRYGIEVTPNQPLLDVDHTHSRLNCLLPRYQSIKGTDLITPANDSKRSQKSKVFVVPELCSIHPVPGYLWYQMCNLPAVLYRIDSLLVAEELRSSLARDLGIGAVNWPSHVPLPLLTLGEMVGEEITCQSEMTKSLLFEEVKTCQSKASKEDEEYVSNQTEIIQDSLFGLNLTCQTENPEEIVLEEKISCQREITKEIPHNRATQNIANQPSTQLNDELLQQFEQLNVKPEHRHIHMFGTRSNVDGLSLISSSDTGEMEVTLNSKTEEISNDHARRTSEFKEHLPVERDVVPRTGQTDSFSSEKVFNQPRCRSALAVDSGEAFSDLENKSTSVTIWNDPCLSSLYQACGPSVTLTLRALTSGGAGDVFSLERLETYGDSFVKYAISSSLFFRHPYENEGKLSFIRGLAVSNRQLFYLARRRGLPPYIFTQTFLPLVNWIPPGFCVNNNLVPLTPVESTREMVKEGDEPMGVTVDISAEGFSSEERCSRDRLNSYLHHSCSDKTIADVTEALIGAYVSCFGAKGAYKFMDWLGMSLTVPGEIEKQLTKPHLRVQDPSETADNSTEPLHDSGVLYDRSLVESAAAEKEHEHIQPGSVLLFPQTRDHFDMFRQIEDSLKYRFTNRALLLQAFTHTSLPRGYNAIHNSYEQLEFLGDAVLDFLVTRHLFLCHRHLSPGELTDLRSAVVNNFSFASLAVNFGFPKLLRSLSPSLFRTVNKFVRRLQERMLKQRQGNPDQVYANAFVVAGEDGEEAVDVEVPKPLGDVFEAVAGAIYVDCAQDLDRVWQVYFPILQPSIEYYSQHPPLSPVRQLLEMMPNAAKFSPAENMVDGKVRCTLTVAGCGKFVGVGRNFRIARSTAAQRALNSLKQNQQKSKTA